MADEELKGQEPAETEDQSEDTEEQAEGKEEEEKSLQDELKEALDVRVEDLGGLRKKLTITVPRDKLGEQLDKQYNEMRQDAVVPGFRKGRAPRRLLEKRFGNDINQTLVQQMLGSGYMAALDKTDLKVIGDPLIWARKKTKEEGKKKREDDKTKGEDEQAEGEEEKTKKEEEVEKDILVEVEEAIELIKLPPDGPLVFSCEVEVRPEFEMPKIEGIPVTKPIITIGDEDINRQVEQLRSMQGTFERVPEGEAVTANDIAFTDVKMTCEGNLVKEQQFLRVPVRPQVMDGVALEKLGETLTGTKVGDVRTVSGQIPDSYIKPELRGKQADFEFKIREIQRLKVPEMNEALLKTWGFDAEQELRDWVRKDLESRTGEEVKRAMAGQVYKYLEDNTTVELPPRLSERNAARSLARMMVDYYRQGIPPAEVEKRLDEIKTTSREVAQQQMKRFFIMEKLAEQFKEIEVSEEEINNLIATIAYRQGRRFDRVRDELVKEGGITTLYLQLRDEKLIDQLLAKAEVTDKAPEAKS